MQIAAKKGEQMCLFMLVGRPHLAVKLLNCTRKYLESISEEEEEENHLKVPHWANGTHTNYTESRQLSFEMLF